MHHTCFEPRLTPARKLLPTRVANCDASLRGQCEFDMAYKDNISISLSTAYLFNYPMVGFARLPVSVTISLSVFACRVSLPCTLLVSPSQPLQVVVTPPSRSSPVPALTLTMLPNFTLDLKSTSLLGSRAKLADVPKLHELIDSQLRRALIRRGTLKIVLPGLSNVEDVKEVEPEREFTLD